MAEASSQEPAERQWCKWCDHWADEVDGHEIADDGIRRCPFISANVFIDGKPA